MKTKWNGFEQTLAPGSATAFAAKLLLVWALECGRLRMPGVQTFMDNTVLNLHV